MIEKAAPLTLDRMALDEVALGPVQLARAIHSQLGTMARSPPVPVRDIAAALDIEEIKEAAVSGFEGALITTPERNVGRIIVKARSSPERQRFSIAHELGHFLIPSHAETITAGIACKAEDMAGSWSSSGVDHRHRQQEEEANRFAIELLAPPIMVGRFLTGLPDLETVQRLAGACAISKHAAVRRYVELHPVAMAVLFAKDGMFTYSRQNAGFPPLRLRRNDRLPILRPALTGTTIEPADRRDWLRSPGNNSLTVQTMWQTNGHSTTLLSIDASEEPDNTDDEEARLPALGVPRFRR